MSEQPGQVVTYSCSQPLPAAKLGERLPRSTARTIDLHCHLLNPDIEALVAGHPQKLAEMGASATAAGPVSAAHNAGLMRGPYGPRLTDIPLRLADMDAMGVDIQALSPSPTQYYYWADRDLSAEIVRRTNERIAEVCAAHPDRFVGLGGVSLQDPALAAEQATHAVRVLGLKGVEVSTLANGRDISDPDYDVFWARMEALSAVVFIHPLGTTLGTRLNQHYLTNIIGQPLETAICLSKMIFSGLLDRHEGLKICAAHGGGYLPLYAGRSDHGRAVRPEACGCRLAPSEYLKRIWFDTVVYDPEHLARLVEAVGVSQLVVGTDYPFDMGHYAPHQLIEAIAGLDEAGRRAILGGNAARMLGIDR